MKFLRTMPYSCNSSRLSIPNFLRLLQRFSRYLSGSFTLWRNWALQPILRQLCPLPYRHRSRVVASRLIVTETETTLRLQLTLRVASCSQRSSLRHRKTLRLKGTESCRASTSCSKATVLGSRSRTESQPVRVDPPGRRLGFFCEGKCNIVSALYVREFWKCSLFFIKKIKTDLRRFEKPKFYIF